MLKVAKTQFHNSHLQKKKNTMHITPPKYELHLQKHKRNTMHYPPPKYELLCPKNEGGGGLVKVIYTKYSKH